MKAALGELTEQYLAALKDYCTEGGEAALLRAYQLGRQALAGGLGVLEMATLHQEALVTALIEMLALDESTCIAQRASEFFAESLAPFELTRRGFEEAHSMLSELNQGLESQLRAAMRDFQAAQQELVEQRRNEQVKDEFICFVSHEVRTPMTAIHGALSLLKKGVGGPLDAQGQQLLDVAYRNSKRLVRLVTDVLDLQRIESGTMTLNVRTLHVRPLLEQAVAANQAYASQFDVTLVMGDTPDRARIRADSDWVMQVLANLISNAAKFSPAGETVVVDACRRDGAIRIAVTDRGPGVPAEFRSRIFQRFAQAEASSSRGGSGLGLSISKALVEQLGGSIGLEVKPGRTTFFFELPEWTPEGEATEEAEEAWPDES